MRGNEPNLHGQSMRSRASGLGTRADSGYELLLPYLPGTPSNPRPMLFYPGEPAQFMQLRGSTAPGRGAPPATAPIIVPVPASQDPSAGEYGLLDPRIADEPALPRDGLLSPVSMRQVQIAAEGQPIPAVEPTPGKNPYKPVPGALRDQTLEIPAAIPDPYDDDWYPFHHALRLSGMPTETEIDSSRITFAFEGGTKPDESGKGTDTGTSVGGVSEVFLEEAERLRTEKKWTDLVLPRDPKQLTPDELASAYRLHRDRALRLVGGGAAPADIHDAKAVRQVADIMFHHDTDGGKMIQKGINDIIEGLLEAETDRLALSPVVVNGIVGPKTFDALTRLVDAGYGRPLRNAIADWRDQFTGRAGDMGARSDYFR